MRACAEAYGDAFTIRLFGAPPFVFCSQPAAVKEIFTGDPEVLLAGRGNEVLRPVFGANSVLLLDGARHRRERKLLMPPFHGERMRLYGGIMREIVDRSIDGWPVDQVFPIHKYMQQITLDIILRTVFGVDEGEMLSRLRALLVEFLGLVGSSPVLLIRRLQVNLGPLTAWKRICELRGIIDQLLYDEIARCKKEALQQRTDIMAMLVAARDEDGQPHERQRNPRRTDHHAGSRARDHGHLVVVGGIPAVAKPERAGDGSGRGGVGDRERIGRLRAHGGARSPNSAIWTPSSRRRPASIPSCPLWLAISKRRRALVTATCRPVAWCRPASTSPIGALTSGRSPRHSSPNVSSTGAWTLTRSSRSAVACATASARRLPATR